MTQVKKIYNHNQAGQEYQSDGVWYICLGCREKFHELHNYCPHCGQYFTSSVLPDKCDEKKMDWLYSNPKNVPAIRQQDDGGTRWCVEILVTRNPHAGTGWKLVEVMPSNAGAFAARNLVECHRLTNELGIAENGRWPEGAEELFRVRLTKQRLPLANLYNYTSVTTLDPDRLRGDIALAREEAEKDKETCT